MKKKLLLLGCCLLNLVGCSNVKYVYKKLKYNTMYIAENDYLLYIKQTEEVYLRKIIFNYYSSDKIAYFDNDKIYLVERSEPIVLLENSEYVFSFGTLYYKETTKYTLKDLF